MKEADGKPLENVSTNNGTIFHYANTEQQNLKAIATELQTLSGNIHRLMNWKENYQFWKIAGGIVIAVELAIIIWKL